ncbi:MAG TPA: hypothetical protein VNO55_06190 [Polyangia bacterium]|nr:hypothetical protein [Polyangia bacterium]
MRSRLFTRSLICFSVVAAAALGCANSESPGGGGTGGQALGSGGSGSGGTFSGSGGAIAGSGGADGSGGTVGTGGQNVAGNSGGDAAGGGGGAPMDAAPTGDAPTGGPTCDGVTTKFCDDFEKQTIGAPPAGAFKVSAAAGAMVVDGTKPHSGTKSMHIKLAAPTSGGAEITFSQQFPFNDQHGRLMMFMNKVPTTGAHWDVVHSRNQMTDWEIGGQVGVFELVCDPPDHGLNSKTKFPEGKWFCLQWQFKYGGVAADNTYVAKVDGMAVEKGMFTGPNINGERWVAGPWRSLNVGWVGYQSSNIPIELWIDDLAFGEQEIPCPAP